MKRLKHCETRVKHRAPLVKHHETLEHSPFDAVISAPGAEFPAVFLMDIP